MYEHTLGYIIKLWINFALAITLHEYGHYQMAIKLGKAEYENSIRNCPNPFMHISLLSMFSGFLFGFMWGKKVEFESSAECNSTKIIQNTLFGLSGIMLNIVVALSAGLLFYFLPRFHLDSSVYIFFKYNMRYFLLANIFVALVSILPLPGLDGFRILKSIFEGFGVSFKAVVLKRLEVTSMFAMGLFILYKLAYYQQPFFDLFEKMVDKFIR